MKLLSRLGAALSPGQWNFLWVGLLVVYILAGTPLVPFHGDEATQITMSRDYAYQFMQRDLSLVLYSNPPISPTEQDLRLLNGTVNKYLIGLAWHLNGFQPDDLNEQWDWGADYAYNASNNHLPLYDLLMAVRWPSALLLAAGAAVMFWLGQALGGRPTAYLASLYYALNPALLLNGRRAMMEGSFTLFSLLTVLAAAWLLLRPSWRSAVGLGLAAGLALASKHTAVFTVVTVFLTSAVYIFVRTRRTWQAVPVHIIVRWLLAVAIALVTFYLLNPAWWGDPFGRASQVLEKRQELLDIQVGIYRGYTGFDNQLAGFLRQTLVDTPQYYEVPEWAGYIGDEIARYEDSPWHGVNIGGSVFGAVVVGGLVAAGVWALLRFRKIRTAVRWLVGMWALAMMLTTLLLTPLEWQRYYLPAYPALGLVAALGASRLSGARMRMPRRRRRDAEAGAATEDETNRNKGI